MVFSSISFLYYFLPLVLFFYFIVPNKFKNYILLLFSLIFYFYGEPKYIILMILEILICYYGSKFIKNNKYNLYILIFIHLLILFVFKYTNFIIFNINSLFNINFNFINIVLPIGISFYTFQIISYEIDVYRKDVEVQNDFFVLAMYISLFPQLVAGPIVRYSDICNDLYNRKCNFSDISYGIKRFIIGLSKKVLLANTLGEFCSAFNSYNDKTLIFYWMYGICFMLQIYFDFSGYSDMAIGLGKMFGFKFLENFNYPYLSQSITEFFRRWHISLGKWFKDYLYIPLGGNRYKLSRNILIVWILTGLWHGASWNFIVWGLYCGIFGYHPVSWVHLILAFLLFDSPQFSVFPPASGFLPASVSPLALYFRSDPVSLPENPQVKPMHWRNPLRKAGLRYKREPCYRRHSEGCYLILSYPMPSK